MAPKKKVWIDAPAEMARYPATSQHNNNKSNNNNDNDDNNNDNNDNSNNKDDNDDNNNHASVVFHDLHCMEFSLKKSWKVVEINWNVVKTNWNVVITNRNVVIGYIYTTVLNNSSTLRIFRSSGKIERRSCQSSANVARMTDARTTIICWILFEGGIRRVLARPLFDEAIDPIDRRRAVQATKTASARIRSKAMSRE